MKIILTGATGLIGSRFEELLFDNHQISPLSSKEVDITDIDSVGRFFEARNGEVVIHLAAKTDVDGCEEDKVDDLQTLNITEKDSKNFNLEGADSSIWKGKNSAFGINSIGTKNLYKVSQSLGMKFVYISTDFVFDGDGQYSEESNTDPINWYGMTKWYGEKIIDLSSDLIVRLSFPYGYKSPVKKDFIQKIIGLLHDNNEVSLIDDQTITPTFIDDIVYGLEFIITHNQTGIIHLTGSSYLSPFEIGNKINVLYSFSKKINRSKMEDVYAGKAARPFQSIMKNDKLKRLGFNPKNFDEGLKLIVDSV